MISVEEARTKILEAISPLGLEKVNILEALGRVIGEDVYAGRAIPPKDNSAMDGYALRAEDTRGASVESPVRLAVVEDIPAGAVPQKRVGPGEAARIMTGVPIPEDADAGVLNRSFLNNFYLIPGSDLAFPDNDREDPLARHNTVADEPADLARHMAFLADLRDLDLRVFPKP